MTDKTRAAVTHWLTTIVAAVTAVAGSLTAHGEGAVAGHLLVGVGVLAAGAAAFGINIKTGDKSALVGGKKEDDK